MNLNEMMLSKYLDYDDFISEKELEVFNSLLYDSDPTANKNNSFEDIFDLFFGQNFKPDPIWENTLHENLFHKLFPFLERQVVKGLGKGSYAKYGVKKYTLDFLDTSDNIAWEIDGESHNSKLQKIKDQKRDLILELEFGVTTYRITNKDVEKLLLNRIRDRKVVEIIGNK